MIDLGAAYLPQNQDPTLAASTTPGATANVTNLLRTYRGTATINQFAAIFYRTMHGLQTSVQRRFTNGFSAGVNWNWTFHDQGNYSADYAVTQRMRAQRRRHGQPARGSGGVGEAHEGPGHSRPHLQGQLRVGHARPARRIDGA